MSGTIQTVQSTAKVVSDRRSSVALIAANGAGKDLGAILAEEGHDYSLFGAVDELLAAEDEPGLILLWVEGPLSTAVSDQLRPLQSALANTPVVMVCAEIRPGELRAALAAGASGALVAHQARLTLGPCIRAVRNGMVCVPRQHATQIKPAALSAREKQVLGLVVMGYMNRQIAEQLFLAESTVKSHLSSAFAKLGVQSRNEAVELILGADQEGGMGILALGAEPIEAISTSGHDRGRGSQGRDAYRR